jgi:hypothetical protein
MPQGGPLDDDRIEIALMLTGSGVADLSGERDHHGFGQVRTRIHYEPFREYALSFDADAAAQTWLGLDDAVASDSRPPVQIRQLQGTLGLGQQGRLAIELGRLRSASYQLGMLDGGRVRVPIGSQFEVGAFGGLMPDPINGQITSNVSRFGVDAQWSAAAHAWRPIVNLSGYGSVFNGRLDERRIQGTAGVYPKFGHIQANWEVAFFDADNMWNADVAELNSAGGDVLFRIGKLDIGGLFQMQRPDKSLFLASVLPLDWFCTTVSAEGDPSQRSCFRDDIHLFYQADLTWWMDSASTDLRFFGSQNAVSGMQQLGGSAHGRLLDLFGLLRVDTSVMGAFGEYYKTIAATVELGLPLFEDRLDLSVRYRPSVNRYEAGLEWFDDHTVGASVFALLGKGFSLGFYGDFLFGRDIDAVYGHLTLTWQPL